MAYLQMRWIYRLDKVTHFIARSALLAAVVLLQLPPQESISATCPETAEGYVDVVFEIEQETTFGNSVFVIGNLPQLGGIDFSTDFIDFGRAVKLEPAAYPVWRATIALPQDTDYEFQYLVRDDSAANLSDPLNGSPIGANPTLARTPANTGAAVQRFISVGLPTDFTHARVSGPSGTVRADVMLEQIANSGRLSAFGLPWGPGDILELYQDGSLPAFRLVDTQSPTFYISGDGMTGSWGLPASAPSGSRIVVHSNFSSSNLGNTRSIRVYLPRGYDTEPARRYPVLYMHDGQNIFFPGGTFGSWDVDRSMDTLIESGAVPEMIVVGIDNTSDRFTEYTPPYQELSGEFGRGDLYARFVIEEVAPFIDSTYRTLEGREWRIVGGSSLGGLISAYMAWDFPDFAERYLCMSPSFQLDEILSRFEEEEARPVVLYFDSGDSGNSNDGLWNTLDARDSLLKDAKYVLGRNLFHTIGYGDSHNEAAWRGRFPNALKTIFSGEFLLAPAGDINSDGCRDVADLVTLVNEKETGAALPALEKPRADRDGSGVIDDADVAMQVDDLLGQ